MGRWDRAAHDVRQLRGQASGRARPSADRGPRPVRASASHRTRFPSAHAATSFAGAVRIGALVPHMRGPLLVAAALMALTRPYLGVHYPSDVVVGAAVGALVGAALEAAS